MRRADRLFQIVQLLRVRRFATAADLADELEVSVRTIYRDIAALSRSGVPVEGEAGVGYRLQRGYELPPLTFNAEELEALTIGARFVRSQEDDELAAAARSALGKIEAVLPSALAATLRDVPVFAPRRIWANPGAGHLGVLRRALADHAKVHFGYTRADGAPSERTVRPLALCYWGTSWTLAAWCELRTDYRNFRLDRMEQVALLEERFEPTGPFTFAAFMARERMPPVD